MFGDPHVLAFLIYIAVFRCCQCEEMKWLFVELLRPHTKMPRCLVWRIARYNDVKNLGLGDTDVHRRLEEQLHAQIRELSAEHDK